MQLLPALVSRLLLLNKIPQRRTQLAGLTATVRCREVGVHGAHLASNDWTGTLGPSFAPLFPSPTQSQTYLHTGTSPVSKLPRILGTKRNNMLFELYLGSP